MHKLEEDDPGARVAGNLYIGSLTTALSPVHLATHRIDAIINLSGTNYRSMTHPVMTIEMANAPVTPANMKEYAAKFANGIEAIESCARHNLNILIHCKAGVNRSAALIAFYLLKHGVSYEHAYCLLAAANKLRGLHVLTNESFRYLLQAQDSFGKISGKKYN